MKATGFSLSLLSQLFSQRPAFALSQERNQQNCILTTQVLKLRVFTYASFIPHSIAVNEIFLLSFPAVEEGLASQYHCETEIDILPPFTAKDQELRQGGSWTG